MAAKKPKPKPAQPEPDSEQAEHGLDEDTRDRFVRGLIERGEAAHLVEGELPPGATHEIVEERPGKPPVVRRRRFSAS